MHASVSTNLGHLDLPKMTVGWDRYTHLYPFFQISNSSNQCYLVKAPRMVRKLSALADNEYDIKAHYFQIF